MTTKKLDAMTWTELNTTLRESDESTAKRLLEWERKHLRRPRFLLRIHGRFNKLRGQREAQELLSSAA